MKLVIAATGASGSIYLQRLLEQIDTAAHEIHLVLSGHAKQVAKQELGAFKIPKSIAQHGENDLNVPFVSGSARLQGLQGEFALRSVSGPIDLETCPAA